MDISNVNDLKRDAARLAERLGWTVGQKRIYRPHMPPRTFQTWLSAWEWLRRIVDDIDAARARRAAEDRNRAPPKAQLPHAIPVARPVPWGRIVG